MRITAERLKELEACQPQLDLFIRLGLDGVEITEELCVKHAQDFDWTWAAGNLLSFAQWEGYRRATEPGWVEYKRAVARTREKHIQATAPAQEKYNRAMAQAREGHDQTAESAFKEYVQATAPAWAEHSRAMDAAWAEYNIALAKAFYAASKL